MSKFSRECCKEFKGWCKSFTRTEALLTFVECVLLLLLVVFLVFLILHLISCQGKTDENDEAPTTKANGPDEDQTTTSVSEESLTTQPGIEDVTSYPYTHANTTSNKSTAEAESIETSRTSSQETSTSSDAVKSIKCTAKYPTKNLKGQTVIPSTRCTANHNATEVPEVDYTDVDASETTDYPEAELPDGELAVDGKKDIVIALVKIKPSGITFGCILTVLSNHWTITAASCLDSIEEVDSLDVFVMMDNYGEVVKGRSHPVSDVRVHPLYEGGNKSYDIALLKTEEPLGRRTVVLPTLVDYFRITIGEKFDILGFGKFRSIDNSALGKRVRSAPVHALPSRQCAGAGLEARHLRPLAPVAHGRCGAAPLCAGVLYARAAPCNYCAGAPLLARGPAPAPALLGVMSDNEACGSSCEPAFYANVASLRDWIEAVLDNK